MALTFTKDQSYKPKPKIFQLIYDCRRAYSSPPNNAVMGISSVAKLFYWHGILKHTRKHFIGKYFKMNFFYDTSSDGAACLYIYPYIEYQVYRFFREWIKKGSVCFDVGSHVGYYPLLTAYLGGFTHSFEANPEMLRLQEINVLLNNYQNRVKLNLVAVGDRIGATSFYRQKNDRALISSLIKDPDRLGEEIKVKMVTLDSYIKENKIKKIDLIKIDVEGAEKLVFAGMEESLKKSIIKTIVWESNYRAPKKDRFEIVGMLIKYGFKQYTFDNHTKKVRDWRYGDEDCISIHKSVEKEFQKIKNLVNKKYNYIES